ncbi:hypothetical protein RADP37_05448 (plasmid) [Roseomonas mucosa]|uniref:Uncharacterized protein n=1 Tax=Roseomonas mucosa TaxID=207340 RepID=A0A4Y1MR97_9PROT|nr:hypothetical protein RADP37_05448 [Roseomonas mucosa]
MGRPRPTDPLWYRLHYTLHLTCRGCGHTHKEKVEEFAIRHRLNSRMQFFEVEGRLRCRRCKQRNVAMDVR